jgi:hypothetical protein
MSDGPTDAELSTILLGRSGTMRAPVLKVGDVLVAGWDEGCVRELLGVA